MRQNTVAAAILMWVASTSLQAQAPASSTVAADRSPVVQEQAPKDHAIAIPKEKLAQLTRDMDAKQLRTLRLVEGGKYNVNLRRLEGAEPALAQPLHLLAIFFDLLIFEIDTIIGKSGDVLVLDQGLVHRLLPRLRG